MDPLILDDEEQALEDQLLADPAQDIVAAPNMVTGSPAVTPSAPVMPSANPLKAPTQEEYLQQLLRNASANQNARDKWMQDIDVAREQYKTGAAELQDQRSGESSVNNLLNSLSKASAAAGGSKSTLDLKLDEQGYRGKEQALLDLLQAKTKAPPLVKLPGLPSGMKQDDPEMRQLQKDRIKANINLMDSKASAAGKEKAVNQGPILLKLAKEYDYQNKANRERQAQTAALNTLLNAGTPQSIEAAKTVMARLSGEVGALSNQDREAYAGSKAYMDQIEQFFNTKILAEGFTPQNKAAFESLMKAFDTSVNEALKVSTNRFETRGQILGLPAGVTSEFMTGLASKPEEQATSSATAAGQTTAAVPVTQPTGIRVRQKASGREKTVDAATAQRLLSDPTKYEEVK